MNQSEKTDLLIIGAGPIGLACAISAKENNMSSIIVEKGVLVNSIYHFPANMTFFSTSRLLEIGDVPFISHSDKPTRREALEYFRRVVDHWNLDIRLYEPAISLQAYENSYLVTTNKTTYLAKNIIVATGFYDTPVLMNVPGEELNKVKHYYDDPHPYIGQNLAIIGAGNSGCDVALETLYKGAKVTMVVREDTIKPSVKYWIRPNIENRIKEGSIKAYFNSNVVEIREREIVISTPDGILTLENDYVLAMTGYQPNYSFIQSLGITINRDHFMTPKCDAETLETNLPNVYLAGVICAGLETNKLFIENSREHANMIINDIIQKSPSYD